MSKYVPELQKIFIGNLKRFRKSKGLSQAKLAEFCDISAGFVGEIEVGRSFPSVKTLEKFSQVLEVKPFEFFVDPDDRKPSSQEEVLHILDKVRDYIRLT